MRHGKRREEDGSQDSKHKSRDRVVAELLLWVEGHEPLLFPMRESIQVYGLFPVYVA